MPGANMLKKNTTLLDANVIIRFLMADNHQLFQKAKKIFRQIEKGLLHVHINEFILCEVVYVLLKVYIIDKEKICNTLLSILEMKNINMENKQAAINALDIYKNNSVDFADSLLISYNHTNKADIISFDKKINKLIR